MAQRRFDADGLEWIVYDVAAASTDVPGTLRATTSPTAHDQPLILGITTWLCFEAIRNNGAKRRLSPIPEGWPNLSEEQLGRLLAIAQPVLR